MDEQARYRFVDASQHVQGWPVLLEDLRFAAVDDKPKIAAKLIERLETEYQSHANTVAEHRRALDAIHAPHGVVTAGGVSARNAHAACLKLVHLALRRIARVLVGQGDNLALQRILPDRPSIRGAADTSSVGEYWAAVSPVLLSLQNFDSSSLLTWIDWERAQLAPEKPPAAIVPLAVDQERWIATVTKTGKTIPLGSEELTAWLKILTDQAGIWVSGTDLTSIDSRLDGRRTDRLRKQLPDPIKKMIETQPGKGARLKLA